MGAALLWDILLCPHAIMHLNHQLMYSGGQKSSRTEPYGQWGLRGRWYHEVLSKQRALQALHLIQLLTTRPEAPGMQEAPRQSVAPSSSQGVDVGFELFQH